MASCPLTLFTALSFHIKGQPFYQLSVDGGGKTLDLALQPVGYTTCFFRQNYKSLEQKETISAERKCKELPNIRIFEIFSMDDFCYLVN